MWTVEVANKVETQSLLEGKIVQLIREVDNFHGWTDTKLRPIALLETLLKLIESVVVDQHADHIVALMQETAGGIQGQRRSRRDDQRSKKIPEERH